MAATVGMMSSPLGIGVMAFNSGQAVGNHLQASNPSLFETIYKVRYVFQALNIGEILWQCKQLVDTLDVWGYVGAFALEVPIGLVAVSTVLVGASWIALAVFAVGKINHYFKPKEDVAKSLKDQGIPAATLAQIKIEWGNSTYQTVQQCIYLSQLVMNVALACLSAHPVFFSLNAALAAYNLAKTSEWKWLHFQRTFNLPVGLYAEVRSIAFSYFCSIFPSQNRTGECTVCLGEEPTSHFCSKHAFHTGCIPGFLYGASENFRRGVKKLERILLGKEDVTYKVTLSRSVIPSCPNCRHLPSQNEVEVLVRDRFNANDRTVSASISYVT